MAAATRLLPHVPTIESETRIRLSGVPRVNGDVRSNFGPQVGKPEGGCDFNARSGEESSPAGRVQRQTGWILLQGSVFR